MSIYSPPVSNFFIPLPVETRRSCWERCWTPYLRPYACQRPSHASCSDKWSWVPWWPDSCGWTWHSAPSLSAVLSGGLTPRLGESVSCFESEASRSPVRWGWARAPFTSVFSLLVPYPQFLGPQETNSTMWSCIPSPGSNSSVMSPKKLPRYDLELSGPPFITTESVSKYRDFRFTVSKWWYNLKRAQHVVKVATKMFICPRSASSSILSKATSTHSSLITQNTWSPWEVSTRCRLTNLDHFLLVLTVAQPAPKGTETKLSRCLFPFVLLHLVSWQNNPFPQPIVVKKRTTASLSTKPSSMKSPRTRHIISSRAVSDPGIPITDLVWTRIPRKGVVTPQYFKEVPEKFVQDGRLSNLDHFSLVLTLSYLPQKELKQSWFVAFLPLFFCILSRDKTIPSRNP